VTLPTRLVVTLVFAARDSLRAKLSARGLCVHCGKDADRREAAEAVRRERQELRISEAVVEIVVAEPVPELCENDPWPWLRPGEEPLVALPP
jgi:hypothetical protein